MTEHRQSSPINLFKPSVSSSTQGASPLGGFDRNVPNDRSFSRELSRASDQSNQSRVTQSRQHRDASESTAKQEKLRSEPRDREPVGSADGSSRTSSSSAGDGKVSKGHARTESKPSEQSKPESTEDTAAENNKVSADDSVVSDKRGASRNDKVSVHTEESTASNQEMLAGVTGVLSSAETLDPEAIAGTSSLAVMTDGNVASAHKEMSSLATDILASDENDQVASAGVTIPLVDTAAVTLDHAKSNLPDNRVHANAAQALVSGEQLSPAQLAVRQAQLASKSATGEQSNTALMGRLVNVTSADVDPDGHAVRLSDSSTTLGQLVNANGNMLGNGGHSGTQDGTSNAGLLKQQLADQPVEGVEGRRPQEADLKMLADMDARVAAQKIDQQMNQTNLIQARQLAMQQIQNQVPASPNAVVEPSSSSAQSADNMFLVVPGGIVTAPVQQRTDAAGMQTISAPLNMPILQGDADKAMAGNIRWMVNEGVKNAVVNVTPSGMGPITVTVGMEKDQMSVSIIALQGSTREALDSMIPRLREQLAAQGHDSVKVDISDGRTEQSDRGYGEQFSDERKDFGEESEEAGKNGASHIADGTRTDEGEQLAVDSQGILQISEGMQVRSSYDVYV